jgi:hypothetical protein
MELYVRPDDLAVVPFELSKLLGYVLAIVIGNDHIPPTDDDFHPRAHDSIHATSTMLAAFEPVHGG